MYSSINITYSNKKISQKKVYKRQCFLKQDILFPKRQTLIQVSSCIWLHASCSKTITKTKTSPNSSCQSSSVNQVSQLIAIAQTYSCLHYPHSLKYTMIRLTSTLAAVASAFTSSADAFSYTKAKMIQARLMGSPLPLEYQEQYELQDHYHPPHPAETGTFDRAVDCANHFGMCDIEEILDLSDGACRLCA